MVLWECDGCEELALVSGSEDEMRLCAPCRAAGSEPASIGRCLERDGPNTRGATISRLEAAREALCELLRAARGEPDAGLDYWLGPLRIERLREQYLVHRWWIAWERERAQQSAAA
jgi:hypothetical protein